MQHILHARVTRKRIIPYLLKNDHAALFWLLRRVYAEDICYSTEIISQLTPAFTQNPLIFLDIGCSSGIDKLWHNFPESDISISGIDPVSEEIQRLQAATKASNIKYYNYFIGTNNAANIHQLLNKQGLKYNMLSAGQATELNNNTQHVADNTKLERVPPQTVSRISLDVFVKRHTSGLADFIKIDTDGYDIDVLRSGTETLKQALGVQVEMNFLNSGNQELSSFSSIDLHLQAQGFIPCKFSPPSLYSLRELPATFEYDIYAQTTRGIPLQCDGIYLRNLTATDTPEQFNNPDFSTICKLISLYVIFGLHDWAVKLVFKYKNLFQQYEYNLDDLLNLLTPKIYGYKPTYQEYISLFNKHPEKFLCSNLSILESCINNLNHKTH